MKVVYLAPPERLRDLLVELDRRGVRPSDVRDQLVLVEGDQPPVRCVFAQNTWLDVQTATFASIGAAAAILRGQGRNWALYSTSDHRRAALIAERLPHFQPRPLSFPGELPVAPVGAWTLLDRNTLLFSAATDSPTALGEYHFEEDKLAPPSRAYLKLWEALTRIGYRPAPGDRCLDLGSSPGGWTWVLAQLGARVISVDKAPLHESLRSRSEITFRAQSAFSLDPKKEERVEWLFSDVVCYPARLRGLVNRWREAGAARHFVCTIKFQRETDFDTLDRFLAIPGSRAVHLHHNKHEVTWFLIQR